MDMRQQANKIGLKRVTDFFTTFVSVKIRTKMKKSIENNGITTTNALKNEVTGKAQMTEVRRRVVTRR
jgi:hypothetical protein